MGGMGPAEYAVGLCCLFATLPFALETVRMHALLTNWHNGSARIEPLARRHVHGQRVVFPGNSMGEDGHTSELSRSVLDFSLAAALFANGAPGKLLPPSTVRTQEVPVFLNDVETRLPCVMSTLDLKQSYTMYMIYADGIVCARVRSQLHLPPLPM